MARKHFTAHALARRRRDLALPPHRRRGPAADQEAATTRRTSASRPSRPTAATSTTARTSPRARSSSTTRTRNDQIYVDPAARPRRPARSSASSAGRAARSGRRRRPTASSSRSSAACAARPCSIVHGPRVGRRAAALRRARPRHAGDLGDPRRLSRRWPGRPDSQVDRLLGRRQDPPHRRREPAGRREIPFHVQRHAQGRRGACASRVEVAPDAFHVKMLRWVAGLAARATGWSTRRSATSTCATCPNGTPRRLTKQNDHFEFYPVVLARRPVDRLHDLGRREARAPSASCRAAGGEGRVRDDRARATTSSRRSRPDGKHDRLPHGSRAAACARRPGRASRASTRSPAAGGEPRRWSPTTATRRTSAPASDRVYFLDARRSEDKTRSCVSSSTSTAATSATHLDQRERHRVRGLARRAAGSPSRERFNAYVAPFVAHRQADRDRPEDRRRCRCQRSRATPASTCTGRATRKQLHWSLGPELFTRELTDAFAFLDGAPEKLPEPPAKRRRHRLRRDDRRADRHASRSSAAASSRCEGDEVIEDGTVVVEGNRIARRRPARRGRRSRPARTSIDVAGKTIIPGLVDVHWHGAHGHGRHHPAAELGAPTPRLAFGVTTIHDPSNDTGDDLRREPRCSAPGMIVAPRIFSTGTILYGATGDVQGRDRQPRRRARAPAAHEGGRRVQRQELQPAAARPAPAGPRRGARARDDGRARGRLALPAQHDDGRRRPHRHRALDPGGAASTTTSSSSGGRRRSATRRRWSSATAASGARTTGTQHTNVWENERLLDASCRARSSTRARAGASMAPEDECNHFRNARDREGAARRRRRGAARRARPARGPRRALGAVDVRAGRHDAAARRCAPARSTARATSAWTATSARSSRASSPT